MRFGYMYLFSQHHNQHREVHPLHVPPQTPLQPASPACPPLAPVDIHLIAHPTVLPFPNCYVNVMIWYVAFYVWPLSRSTTGPSHAVVRIGASFLLVVE